MNNLKSTEKINQYKNELKNKIKGLQAENFKIRWKKLEEIVITTAMEHLEKKEKKE